MKRGLNGHISAKWCKVAFGVLVGFVLNKFVLEDFFGGVVVVQIFIVPLVSRFENVFFIVAVFFSVQSTFCDFM